MLLPFSGNVSTNTSGPPVVLYGLARGATPVQTRDERADLVYAVKIRVPNPGGALKIGMPADVTLPALARS